MNKHILFVHIPKTAGTSFRLAAKKEFSKENTFYDYSPSSTETSRYILDYVYEKQDMYKLSQKFKQHNKLFLSGHFHAGKYMPLFETLNVVTFVRNPVDQVLSHYKHYVKNNNYKKDIITFIKENRFKNIQSKMLGGRALELYGFIGLTEEYNKSIELINSYYGLNLEVLTLNTAVENKKLDELFTIETIDLIKKENKKDIELYEKAKQIFNKKYKCFTNKQPYTYGLIQELTNENIRGIAFQKESKKPIEIEIYNEDKLLTSISCTKYRQGIASYSLTRKGFVGFDYKFDEPIIEAGNIKVIVKNTKQEII
ncbi:MAG: sulfotransferase family 2 domain-containing protein [Campylobacterota bacterium]|nr:sulfotransferase family 2 domain-containing protein [Campylobacterota bacterium]